jgi:hypothetical protein
MEDRIEGEINNALDGLLEMRAEYMSELSGALDTVAQLKAGIARIDKVLRAAEDKPKAKKAGNNGKPTGAATVKRAEEILTIMAGHPEKADWLSSELARELGMKSTGPTTEAINYLREGGKIRPTRTVKGGGHAYATYPA